MAENRTIDGASLDPYAALFPLGILSGLLGALLWILFEFRAINFFPKEAHANLMVFGLFWAFVSGFLMTAVPRMTKTRTASTFEWFLPATLIIFQWVFAIRNLIDLGFWLAGLQWLALIVFLGRRFLGRQQLPFAGFVFIPFGFLNFLLGLLSHFEFPLTDPTNRYLLLSEAFLLNLICGLGSRLIPMISRIPQITAIDQSGSALSWRGMFGLALTLNLTFVFEVLGQGAWAILVRSFLLLYMAIRHFRIWSRASETTSLGLGLRVAVWFMVLGTFLRSISIVSALASQHLLFIGGFALVTLMVATRVSWAHGGQDLAGEGRLTTPLYVMALLTMASLLRFWLQADLASTLVTASAVLFSLGLTVWAGRFSRLWFATKVAVGFLFCLNVFDGRSAMAKVVHYDLHIRRDEVNLSGKKFVDFALSINNQIPAPTLEFTEGDEAEIIVHNELIDQEASIHWHGVLLPNDMDGVPYLNTPPILPGSKLTFRFPIRQAGTYWYHSHTSLQEQKGLFGALVFHPRPGARGATKFDRDLVLVLSDWSDENPDQVLANLRKTGDYYSFKKGTIRSWWDAFRKGHLFDFLKNEWSRMPGMDLSDVGYDAFLVNGKRSLSFDEIRENESVRLRLINASSSTYFHIRLADQLMTVIAADGLDVRPIKAKELLMGMAETYDLSWVQKPGRFELLASAQDLTGEVQVWLGAGLEHPAPRPAPLNLYESMDHMVHADHAQHAKLPRPPEQVLRTNGAVAQVEKSVAHQEDHPGHQDHQDHQNHQDQEGRPDREDHRGHEDHKGHEDHEGGDSRAPSAVIDQLTVDNLMSLKSTEFKTSKRQLEMKLVLGGDMDRYIWHLNGKTIAEDRTIEIQTGDIVRFQLINETMMHHPIHLHGHFFRVVTEQAGLSPLKHTVDVPPHSQRTIEFRADEPGLWMIHCHNLYHMKTGMARVIQYSDFTPRTDILQMQKQDPHGHEHIYTMSSWTVATNLQQAFLRFSRTRDQVEVRFENRAWDDLHEVEGDLLYRRWITNYFTLTGGLGHFAPYDEFSDFAQVGATYRWPLMIESQLTLDHRGRGRLQLSKRFQWTRLWMSEIEWNLRHKAKGEFVASLLYNPSWRWAVGAFVTEEKIGVGLRAQF